MRSTSAYFFIGLEVAGLFMEEKHLEEEFGEEYQQYGSLGLCMVGAPRGEFFTTD